MFIATVFALPRLLLTIPLLLVGIGRIFYTSLFRRFPHRRCVNTRFWSKVILLNSFRLFHKQLMIGCNIDDSIKLFLTILEILSLRSNLRPKKNLLHIAFSFIIGLEENLSNYKTLRAYSLIDSFSWVRLLNSRAFFWITDIGKYCSFKEDFNWSNLPLIVGGLLHRPPPMIGLFLKLSSCQPSFIFMRYLHGSKSNLYIVNPILNLDWVNSPNKLLRSILDKFLLIIFVYVLNNTWYLAC